ncbi:hypothetical protein KCMC57_up38290 [Kitasatospora sp. CMC57]|uniref:Uncharacterized protein n=1 Tax=Kitasatospora sp. CMC57 TaxID=3231513 RepID=A0AB33K4N7_9ACTN
MSDHLPGTYDFALIATNNHTLIENGRYGGSIFIDVPMRHNDLIDLVCTALLRTNNDAVLRDFGTRYVAKFRRR